MIMVSKAASPFCGVRKEPRSIQIDRIEAAEMLPSLTSSVHTSGIVVLHPSMGKTLEMVTVGSGFIREGSGGAVWNTEEEVPY